MLAATVVVVASVVFAVTYLACQRCNRPDIAEKRVEIAAFVAGFVGVIATGVLIPYQINAAGSDRQDRATCFASVLALRKALDQLNLGYTVAPQQDNQRMADWQALGTDLENADYGCQRAKLPGASRQVLEDLRAGLAGAEANSAHLGPDRAYLTKVGQWTTSTLDALRR